MLDLPLVFLDLETTGATATHDRITEVGLVEVADGREVARWSTLVNPQTRIPGFIESLTGITNDMVADAPVFESFARELHARLAGKVLVAHNARFDYGFLKNEFARAGIAYRSRLLCTVRLSRALFPQERRHNLDSLIERHQLECSARHRALGDAEVLWQFVQKLPGLVDDTAIDRAVQAQFAKPSLPPGLSAELLDEIPDTPGVYLFYGDNDMPLYVGKSVELRSRVLSHFSGDHRLSKDMRIAQEVKRVEWIETAGELGALLNEARLIKELLPILNRTERRQSGFFGFEWAGDVESGQPVRLVASGRDEPARLETLFGLFRTRRAAQDALAGIALEHGLCPALLGLEARRATGGACFAHQIRRCRGACCGKETLGAHNLRLFEALQALRVRAWPWRGAIGIRERGGQRTDIHLFDHWCFLGTATEESAVYDKLETRAPPLFDLDIYKILQKALAAKKKPEVIDFGPMSSLWYRAADAA